MQGAFFDELEAGHERAQKCIAAGEYRDAFDILHGALLRRMTARSEQRVAAVGGDLQVIEQLASLAVLFGEHDAADKLFQSYSSFARNAGNRYAADYASLLQAQVAFNQGELRRAESWLLSLGPAISEMDGAEFSNAGLEHWESGLGWQDVDQSGRTTLLSQIYLVKGELLAANGQYRAAIFMFERGIALAKDPAAPDVVHSACTLLKLGYAAALLEIGDLDAAEGALSDIARTLNSILEPGAYVQGCEIAGKLYMLRGNFGEAVRQFELVKATCAIGQFGRAYALALLNLAQIHILLNRTSEAVIALAEVRDRARQTRDAELEMRAAFLSAVAQARSNSLADGVPIVPSVFQMWGGAVGVLEIPEEFAHNPLDLSQSSGFLAFFEDRALAFHWFLSKGDHESAGSVLAWMTDVFSETDSRLLRVRIEVMHALLAYYLGRVEQAAIGLDAARAKLEEIGLRPELWQALRVLGWCWARIQRPEVERHALATLANAMLEDLTESLPSAEQAIFLLNKWTTEEEYIAGKVEALGEAKRKARAAQWYRRPLLRYALLRNLQALIDHLERHKRRLAATLVGHPEPEPIEMRPKPMLSRLMQHSPLRATVSFIVLPDRVVIIYRGFFQLDFGVSAVSRIQIREMVRGWHYAANRQRPGRHVLSMAKRDRSDELRSTAQLNLDAMARALQIPALLAILPSRIRALTLEPDDSLHGFPFSALKFGGRFLIQRFALSVDICHSHERGQGADVRDASGALLVGVSRGTKEFEPLPGVKRELECVRKKLHAYGRISILEDDAATKDTLMASLPNVRLAHFACHGTFRADQPDQSGLVLVPRPGHSECLSLQDLSRLDLSRVEHITLASCWSADNFILPGRWILSLPQVLRTAGTASVLACLWPVDDDLAVQFMSRFYDHLRHYARDEAMRRTQLEWLAETGSIRGRTDLSAPFFWAGFVLCGDPSRLRSKLNS